MIVLGIDQSLCATGYVVLAGPVLLETGTHPTLASTPHHDRLFSLETCLRHVILRHEPRLVVREAYAFAAHQAHTAGEVGWAVDRTVHHADIPLVIVRPQALKAFVTGHATAKKSDMKQQVYKRWGYETADDNIADAYGLAMIGLAILDEYPGLLTQAQEGIIERLLHPPANVAPRRRRVS